MLLYKRGQNCSKMSFINVSCIRMVFYKRGVYSKYCLYIYIYVYIDTVLSEHCIHQTSTSSCHFVVGNSPPVSESFWMSRVASLACFRSILEHLPKFELRELYKHLIIPYYTFMLLHWLFLFRRKHGLQKLDLGLKGSMETPCNI